MCCYYPIYVYYLLSTDLLVVMSSPTKTRHNCVTVHSRLFALSQLWLAVSSCPSPWGQTPFMPKLGTWRCIWLSQCFHFLFWAHSHRKFRIGRTRLFLPEMNVHSDNDFSHLLLLLSDWMFVVNLMLRTVTNFKNHFQLLKQHILWTAQDVHAKM